MAVGFDVAFVIQINEKKLLEIDKIACFFYRHKFSNVLKKDPSLHIGMTAKRRNGSKAKQQKHKKPT